MTDKEALEILLKDNGDMDSFFDAVAVATVRLKDCQWHDYNPEEFKNRLGNAFGSRVILGIRYDDGSRDSVNGYVMYSMDNGYYLAIDYKYKNHYTENAVIEKWMKYPDYN